MRSVERQLDPKAVKAKMREFRKSEEAFYAKYGGGPSALYDLIGDDGCRYPLAPIVQAALGWVDVKGGVKARDSAGRALRAHGFRVVAKGSYLDSQPVELDQLLTALERIATNEREGTSKYRIGADALRKFALHHRIGCEVTGLKDQELLRVSHIVSWSEDRSARLNPENIILLSALWDAAFDRGLVSFDESGTAIFSNDLSTDARKMLTGSENYSLALTDMRRGFLSQHRTKHGFK